MVSLLSPFRRIIPKRWRKDAPLVPVVRLSGPIGLPAPLVTMLTFETAAPLLDRAFRIKDAPAVALIVNSPGGSAVQSHLIFKRIRALAETHSKPVYVFIEDAAASGGYMIACAGDEIIADPSSIVGSIGVVSAGFGFDRAIERLGIDRRVYTAGDRKVMLDGFQPEKPEDVRRLRALQKDIHKTFMALVKERRGKELDGSDRTLFSGEFWAGQKALDLGLIDQIGDIRSFLFEKYGDKVRMVPIAARRGLFNRPRPGVSAMTDGIVELAERWPDSALSAVEARMLWQRLGL
ncbi:MAG: S49 family peptidase [Pseudomonadota bacterium]